jgi:hypothetical protein
MATQMSVNFILESPSLRRPMFGFCFRFALNFRNYTQASRFSNAKHAIPSPERGKNSVFRGKY